MGDNVRTFAFAPKAAPATSRPRGRRSHRWADHRAMGAKAGSRSSSARASTHDWEALHPAALGLAFSNRSECVIPRPAIIQFTSPGRMSLPRRHVAVHDFSAKRYVTVESPIWGGGRTSRLFGMPGGKSTGPKRSKKIKGRPCGGERTQQALDLNPPPRVPAAAGSMTSLSRQPASDCQSGSLELLTRDGTLRRL